MRTPIILLAAALASACAENPAIEGPVDGSVTSDTGASRDAADTAVVVTDTSVADATDAADASETADATDATDVADATGAVMPDFSLRDENTSSATYGTNVSPRAQLGKVSAWYFGTAT